MGDDIECLIHILDHKFNTFVGVDQQPRIPN
jgi:hypothetical protein